MSRKVTMTVVDRLRELGASDKVIEFALREIDPTDELADLRAKLEEAKADVERYKASASLAIVGADALQRALDMSAQAAHAERDMHWKAKVENLQRALDESQAREAMLRSLVEAWRLAERHSPFRHTLDKALDATADAARAYRAQVRREAFEEAAKVAGHHHYVATAIRALAGTDEKESK